MNETNMVKGYAGRVEPWPALLRDKKPLFACALGFTATALIPGISAAGSTPEARRYTALADAEVLLTGSSPRLPTSPAGYPSPVVISRAVVMGMDLPVRVFDCGLPESWPETIRVGSEPARCLSTGRALSRPTVESLFAAGQRWGRQLPGEADYLVVGECVAGGTTTALALLLGLGWPAAGMVNSTHPVCNHAQKLALVEQGLARLGPARDGLGVAAALGDPMQPFVAGLALAASGRCPVLLAGGTQMLAVYALMARLGQEHDIAWDPKQVAVGTTRWVAEDPSGDTVGLAKLLGPVPLLATQLSFAQSLYPQLRAYERGYVKEGVGAGGLAIAASLSQSWDQPQLLGAVEASYRIILAGSQASSSGAMVNPS